MEQMLYFEKQIIFAVAFVSCHLISRLEEKRIPSGTNQNELFIKISPIKKIQWIKIHLHELQKERIFWRLVNFVYSCTFT